MSTGFSTHLGPPGVGTIMLPISPLSTNQYLRMIDAGILGPDDKVELIGGLITPMAPAGPEHNGSLLQLTDIFASRLDEYQLLIQGTVSISEGHVLDPDVALLRRKPGRYRKLLPTAEDILLIVEAASTSLPKDRHVKLPVYAAAGVQEYWIADLERQVLHVFRDPQDANYTSEMNLSGDETISPLACPELMVRVGEIFA